MKFYQRLRHFGVGTLKWLLESQDMYINDHKIKKLRDVGLALTLNRSGSHLKIAKKHQRIF